MLTASKFAQMIMKAGWNTVMSCSDMCDAYKMTPVRLQQRQLQAHKFCSALFIELKLVFGYKMACAYLDRIHDCIIKAFVPPMSGFPALA